MLRVAQIGLGPIGNQMTACMLAKGGIEIVAAADLDPDKQGRDVAELAQMPGIGVEVAPDLGNLSSSGADLVILTTLSKLDPLLPQLEDCLSRGLNVVSTCEELSFPWVRHPELAREIDGRARKHNVTILGTGVNPGFMMDYLPAVLTGVCQSVESVIVERFQDAAKRRLPFQQKIGAGLEEDEFRRRVAQGRLGHVGLLESIDMLAAGLGWDLDSVKETIEPVLVEEAQPYARWDLKRGCARGLHQVGMARRRGQESIRLVFRACLKEPKTYDRIMLNAQPPVDLKVSGGVHGDVATASISVNAAPIVLAAPAGLKTMLDLPPARCYAPGGPS